MQLSLASMIAIILFLTGCVALDEPILSGRDMKQMLDSKAIDCEPFDVSTDEDSKAELLSCLDGTASEQYYFFLIWESSQERNAAFSDFCFNLARRGNASEEMIVGETWVAYSESNYFPASALATELGSEILSGEDFCTLEGFEIAETLNANGKTQCQQTLELYGKFDEVSIRELGRVSIATARNESLDLTGRIGFFNGRAMNVSADVLTEYEQSLRKSLRGLITDPETPSTLVSAAKDIDYRSVSKASTLHKNGTSPAFLFTELPDDMPRNATDRQLQEVVDHMNLQIDEHNMRVAEFNVAKSVFMLDLALVLDTCQAYTPTY